MKQVNKFKLMTLLIMQNVRKQKIIILKRVSSNRPTLVTTLTLAFLSARHWGSRVEPLFSPPRLDSEKFNFGSARKGKLFGPA